MMVENIKEKLPNIYEYSSFHQYLRNALVSLKEINDKFSYRWISKKLQLRSASTLAHISSGNRLPTESVIEKISHILELSKDELNYARTMVKLEKAESNYEKSIFQFKLNELKPKNRSHQLEEKEFNLISEWYYIAILEMTYFKDFSIDPHWIQSRLRFSVPLGDIKRAVSKLVELNLLQKNSRDKWQKAANSFAYSSDVPKESIRNYHRQLLKLADATIDQQDINTRYLKAQTMTIDPAKIELAQEIIDEFFQKMRTCMTPERGGDATYQIALQYFCVADNTTTSSEENIGSDYVKI